MSDCGVCLTGYDGDTDFCHTEIRKARKKHVCCECSKEILPGEQYERASGKSEGDFWDAETCMVCAEIAQAFYCDGRWFGGVLWEHMDEVLSEMTTGCLNRLKTARAKAELMKRWNEWKFGDPKRRGRA